MVKAAAKLNQLNIIVGDMRASADFYRRLGVEISANEELDQHSSHINGELQDDFHLDFDSPQFVQIWNTGWAGHEDLVGRVVVGFHVETRNRVDELFRELTDAGYSGLSPPVDAFWGARYAIVQDPNGIAVGLMSPVDPQRRYWPPQNWKS